MQDNSILPLFKRRGFPYAPLVTSAGEPFPYTELLGHPGVVFAETFMLFEQSVGIWREVAIGKVVDLLPEWGRFYTDFHPSDDHGTLVGPSLSLGILFLEEKETNDREKK